MLVSTVEVHSLLSRSPAVLACICVAAVPALPCSSCRRLLMLLLVVIPAGYYNNGTQYYCAKCPMGSTTPWMGATSIDDVSGLGSNYSDLVLLDLF